MLNELSPELLQHAAEKSREMRRYKQADNLESGATYTLNNELNPGGNDQKIRYNVKSVSWITPDRWSCVLCYDGNYRTSHLYGNGCTTTGNLSGSKNVPNEMKTDAAQARKIVGWWKRFGKVDLPQFNDWHNLVNYGVNENIQINKNDIKQMVNEVIKQLFNNRKTLNNM